MPVPSEMLIPRRHVWELLHISVRLDDPSHEFILVLLPLIVNGLKFGLVYIRILEALFDQLSPAIERHVRYADHDLIKVMGKRRSMSKR